MSVVLTRELSRFFDVGAAWVYGTGTAATLAQSRYLSPGVAIQPFRSFEQVTVFSDVNGFRMPAYHRLDLSASWFLRRGAKPRALILNVYNAYNRKNIFYADWQTNDEGEGVLIGYALLPIIPSLAFRFSF